MRILCVALLFLLLAPVYAMDTCREFFSHEAIESIETRDILLYNGGYAKKVIVNYQNGVSINVLRDLPVGRWKLILYTEMFRTVFYLGGRVVKFGVKSAIENSPKINCHGYACLKNNVPGLPEGWLDGARPYGTLEHRSPIQVLLDSFFHRVKVVKKEEENLLETDPSLREGDLVHYLDSEGNSVHSGLVIQRQTRRGSRFWIRSKIGELMTIDLQPQKMGAVYNYSHIEVWRRNSQIQ